MTTPDEARAREFLADEYPDDGSKQLIMTARIDGDDYIGCAVRAIQRALGSQATGADERAAAALERWAEEWPEPTDFDYGRRDGMIEGAKRIRRGDHRSEKGEG